MWKQYTPNFLDFKNFQTHSDYSDVDLYIICYMFLGKRLIWKLLIGPSTGQSYMWDSVCSFMNCMGRTCKSTKKLCCKNDCFWGEYTWDILKITIFLLIVKFYIDLNIDLFSIVVVAYALIALSFKYNRYQAAPYEVMHIVKICFYHSIENVWFCAYRSSEVYSNPVTTVMEWLCIFGNSFSLMSTHFIDKRYDELKYQAQLLGYWK